MKRLIAGAAAAAAAAFILLRPLPAPAPAPQGWSAAVVPGGAPMHAAPGRGVPAAEQGAPATEHGAPAAEHGAAAPVHGASTPASRSLAYVAGEVLRPGVYPVGPDARVKDVLAAAGGTKAAADMTAINLAAHVRDGDAVIVPARGAPRLASAGAIGAGAGTRTRGPRRSRSYRARAPAEDAGAQHAARSRRGRGPRANAPPGAEVDINAADAATLATIPGIGDGLAERIVEFRRVNGPFASVDELLDVAGITEHRLDAIIPYVVAR